MMDEFDEKHKMMQKLLGMLKDHASSEVAGGLAKPEGEGDMHGLEVERVEVAPHEMDHSTPEHDVDTKEYHTGGIVDKVSPEIKLPMEPQSGEGEPEMEGAAHKEALMPLETREAKATEEDQEPHDRTYAEAESEPSSMFQSFLSRKKKR
jgi:hypothetical protein